MQELGDLSGKSVIETDPSVRK